MATLSAHRSAQAELTGGRTQVATIGERGMSDGRSCDMSTLAVCFALSLCPLFVHGRDRPCILHRAPYDEAQGVAWISGRAPAHGVRPAHCNFTMVLNLKAIRSKTLIVPSSDRSPCTNIQYRGYEPLASRPGMSSIGGAEEAGIRWMCERKNTPSGRLLSMEGTSPCNRRYWKVVGCKILYLC
ncbi:unnamed protein product [Rhizoctonia solani]|uniref:Uncharacterized protein n=1 Tax=Rhizoctonia solani TaxID=456999 RepID=A0A8H3BCK5_9AGAM|nr:unnamed protein product [Rhizoctonia solani]